MVVTTHSDIYGMFDKEKDDEYRFVMARRITSTRWLA
jgi:hypothetical protein